MGDHSLQAHVGQSGQYHIEFGGAVTHVRVDLRSVKPYKYNQPMSQKNTQLT